MPVVGRVKWQLVNTDVQLETDVKAVCVRDNNDNNRFMTCPGLPGLAGTRRNTHPPTILIIIQSLSASSIYHDP